MSLVYRARHGWPYRSLFSRLFARAFGPWRALRLTYSRYVPSPRRTNRHENCFANTTTQDGCGTLALQPFFHAALDAGERGGVLRVGLVELDAEGER